MSSYTRRITVSDLSRFRYAAKSANDEVRADCDTNKVAIHSSEKDTDLGTKMTLDDFGGRSDALGG
jgi:hypothetical protein